MTIKILGGKLKGLELVVPPESITRPMSVLLRRRLFDRYQDLTDVIFVDLCAGSGACGFEAYSRGAKEVWINDPSPVVQKVLKKNLLQMEKRLKKIPEDFFLSQLDATKLIKNFCLKYQKLDESAKQECMILMAPPYPMHELYFQILQLISSSWYKGLLVIESDENKGPEEKLLLDNLPPLLKKISQGEHYLLVIDFDCR
jgi:16S rRNA (guanine966-N2)-methyltransferase